MANLKTEFAGLKLKNPVMPAAGPPIKDARAAVKAKEGGAGAIVTKTISTTAAKVPRPNMARVKSGFLNTELWSELPPEKWLNEEYPKIRRLGLPVIAGIGYTKDQIKSLAKKVEKYADALELSTHYLGNDTTPMEESIKAAKDEVEIPVFVKLSPQIDIPEFAEAAEKAGADGIVLINSFGPTLDINPETGKPLMGSENGFGWLSGEAIFPLALRAVYQAANNVNIPVIGVGGIDSGIKVAKMFMAGASAVQVCTEAIVNGPHVYEKINNELNNFLDKNNYQSLKDIQNLTAKVMQKEANYDTIVPTVIKENCTTCGLCVTSCVYQAISLNESNDYIVIDSQKCEGCGLCITRCNFNALKLE
ncbi:MAG: 4Fe-4S binding protein [Halanaerobiales bacterium]|nr:4Fe-4S binding protein [Halanaerobiales bacterium]